MTEPVLAHIPEQVVPIVRNADVVAIVAEVWASFVEADRLIAGPADVPTANRLTACVTISGAWDGSVVMETTPELAMRVAVAMFRLPPSALRPEDVADSFGELTNMVGGNVKSLLPAPCAISTPTVTLGAGHQVRLPGAVLGNRVPLTCDGEPLVVGIWRSDEDW